ncbi:2934_t:CDS:2, partial [Funneliformis geosporum]
MPNLQISYNRLLTFVERFRTLKPWVEAIDWDPSDLRIDRTALKTSSEACLQVLHGCHQFMSRDARKQSGIFRLE